MNTPSPSLEDAIAVLLHEQRKIGGPIIEYPVSLLQRRLLLGYTRTLVLVEELERRGVFRRIGEATIELLEVRSSVGDKD